jgi:periplasmic copper chaperone A
MHTQTTKRLLVMTFLTAFFLNACGTAAGIKISNAWARPALQNGNGAVYFLLQNHSAAGDELTSVSSESAQAVEIHESKMDGDVMQMRQISSVPIGGKESIEFGPGGYHVMLVGLNQELKAGSEVQVTFHFKNHEDISVPVQVSEMEPATNMGEH